MYNAVVKRGLDIGISMLAIIACFPLLTGIGIMLAFANGGQVFFIQRRPGFKVRPINVVKFKTMTDERNVAGNLLPNHLRTTKIGGWLRKMSLDELPQLFNVLVGQMSLIGPRPLLYKYMPLFNRDQMRRHDVRPGITGWAQINGRNAITWTKKLEFDIWYVDHISFLLDVKILWLTIQKVVKREGINKDQQTTSEPFNGHN